jgi:hypothetical protein
VAAGRAVGARDALDALDAPLLRVRAALEEIFGHVERVADALAGLHGSCLDAGEELTAERLGRLRDVIGRRLDELPAAAGLGVVAAPGVVAGRERHLEWWQRAASAAASAAAGGAAGGGYTRLRLNLDRASVDLYDYLDMDWFTVPRAQRRRCVYGPYIDFTCADRYVLTMTMPVLAHPGTFLGIAGADVAMSHFEPDLLAIMRSVPGEAVLVTAERRVLAANTPRWIAGSRLPCVPRAGDGTFGAAAEVGGDSGWVLAVAAANP